MFIFSEFNSISKAEISELIETKTKMMETEIELIKAKTKLLEAKCLSEAEIIELVKSKFHIPIRSANPIGRPSKIGSNSIVGDFLTVLDSNESPSNEYVHYL